VGWGGGGGGGGRWGGLLQVWSTWEISLFKTSKKGNGAIILLLKEKNSSKDREIGGGKQRQ